VLGRGGGARRGAGATGGACGQKGTAQARGWRAPNAVGEREVYHSARWEVTRSQPPPRAALHSAAQATRSDVGGRTERACAVCASLAAITAARALSSGASSSSSSSGRSAEAPSCDTLRRSSSVSLSVSTSGSSGFFSGSGVADAPPRQKHAMPPTTARAHAHCADWDTHRLSCGSALVVRRTNHATSLSDQVVSAPSVVQSG